MEADSVVAEVYPKIFLSEITLPRNPLKVLNSYVIMSEEKNLVIDTGFNLEECQSDLLKGLDELGIDLAKTELLITHMHTDHSGLTTVLLQRGVQTVYFSPRDGALFNNITHKETFVKTILDLNELYGLTSINPFNKDFGKRSTFIDFTPLTEGDEISIGDYRLEVVDIPGHTPGHLGLYERKHKLFFCGDHILDEITPNITFWGFEQDVLAMYMDSLRKVYTYDIDYLFAGHRRVIRDHRKRIEEILHHHQERLREIVGILQSGEKAVSEVASRMNWDVGNKTWEELPDTQKWFASGEAMSHLEHLVYTGVAIRSGHEGKITFKLC